ncbi:hypothetical protein RvY_12863 [Ramazzottius varieornatus]|uniref:G-protein coupled receptors family 1 profile domain-containing protein n=1 Tax=Ramazzottius varieornatus TaxID=947166 RepID=A0A1D1VQ15_RAMVA|nr:hypothetical protein RvY_12863 [Ramazzottius varieornatus]
MAPGQLGLAVYNYYGIPYSCPFTALGYVFHPVTNWADVALSANRMVAVMYPHYYTHLASVKSTSFVCMVVWLFGITLVAVITSGVGTSSREVQPGACVLFATSKIGTVMVMFVSTIPVCVCGLVIASLVIHLLVHRRAQSCPLNVQVTKSARQTVVHRRTLALAKVMIASFIWCLISTLPFYIGAYAFATFLAKSPRLSEALKIFATTEYSVNPFYRRHWTSYAVLRCRPAARISSLELHSRSPQVPSLHARQVVSSE